MPDRSTRRRSRADNEYRCWRIANDVIGNAADQEPAHHAAPVTPDDDEIRRLRGGRLYDGLTRLAFPDQEVDPDMGRATARDELLDRCLSCGPNLVDAPAECSTGQSKRARIDHADGENRCPKLGGEVERAKRRRLRGR